MTILKKAAFVCVYYYVASYRYTHRITQYVGRLAISVANYS